MKFIELTVNGEKITLNSRCIISFTAYDGGTYIKLLDGKSLTTELNYDAVRELLS